MRTPTLLLTTALSLLTHHTTTAIALPSTSTSTPDSITTSNSGTTTPNFLTLLTPSAAAAALKRANLTLPTSDLPTPPAGLTLKYVAIGLGTQNYTCVVAPAASNLTTSTTTTTTTSTTPSTTTTSKTKTNKKSTPTPTPTLTPTSFGAIATLHDATRLLTSGNVPLPYALPALPCIANALNFALNLPLLGHHYFSPTLTPTFDLAPVGLFFSGKKTGDVAAPQGSCTGREGQAAVDWLMLGDDGTGVSEGVKLVYRVEVAGGKSLGCEGEKVGAVVTSDYAAEYWFYG